VTRAYLLLSRAREVTVKHEEVVLEVERSKERATPRRARFTGSMVDSRLLKRGQDITELPDRYTIFITEEDEFEEGLPLYHAEYTVSELKHSPLGDGSFIIYVNGQYRNPDTPIGKLMHDFSCSKADDILNPILRERVRTLKETERGREEVCKIMENRITEEKIELAKNAIKSGELTLEQIAKVLDLSLPIVEELARTQAVGA
jgi:predicted HTH domain antitoxin